MSKVEIEYDAEIRTFVVDSDGDVYIRARVSGDVYYILLDGGGVFCEEKINSFKIRPVAIGSVIKITV